jgi:hypothetical protein
MPEGNGQPSTGLMALGAGALVLCCLVPLLLLSLGAAGLAALIFDNVWWLGLGLAALALAVVGTRIRRATNRTRDTFRGDIANE